MKPNLPSVEGAVWLKPYKHSGVCPPNTLLLMFGLGALIGAITGAVGYYGGFLTSFLAGLWVGLAAWVSGCIGKCIGTVIGVLYAIWMVIFLGIGYPVVLGGILGYLIWSLAKTGKCRNPNWAGAAGFLSGAIAYAVFVFMTLQLAGGLHETSHMTKLIKLSSSSSWMYVIVTLDALILIFTSWVVAFSMANDTPFCENCNHWYLDPQSANINIYGADFIVMGLEKGFLHLLLDPLHVASSEFPRLELALQKCPCGKSDFRLRATCHWQETKTENGETKTEDKTEIWFTTMLSQEDGHRLESALSSTPAKPAPAISSKIVPPSVPEPLLTKSAIELTLDSNKKCPCCGNEIKAEAKVCRHCKASFDIGLRGYCTACHQVMEADLNKQCIKCGTSLVDIRIISKLIKQGIETASASGSGMNVERLIATPDQQEDSISHITRWLKIQKDKPIQVNIISCFGGREDSITSAHGRLLTIEEHPVSKGVFRASFDSHLGGRPEEDAVMLGYEITSVEEKGNQLIVHKGPDQRFELVVGVEPEAPSASTKTEWPDIPGYNFQSCFPCGGKGSNGKCESCEGYGKILVREPARRCPICGGNGYLTEQELYIGPMCKACRGTGWQNALKYSEAIAFAK